MRKTFQWNYYSPDRCLVNDAVLLHLSTCTQHAVLGQGDFTAQGILSASEVTLPIRSGNLSSYQAVFHSSGCKYVEFIAQKSVVDHFFTLRHRSLSMTSDTNYQYLRNRRRSTIMRSSKWVDGYCLVEMGRMNASEQLHVNHIYWPKFRY